MKQGQFIRHVYLPFADKSWKDVLTGAVYQGGDWHPMSATLEYLPMFVLASNDDIKKYNDAIAAKNEAYIKNQKVPDVPQTKSSPIL
jgi:alpha-glucosidase (family GH31 glycosyl hydrolase)